MGKTFQTVAFLSGLFDSGCTDRVLLVAPVSVLPVWQDELKKWAPGVRVRVFHGSNVRQREHALRRVLKKGGVCLTTYGMVTSNAGALGAVGDGDATAELVPDTTIRRHEIEGVGWGYVICDEGHKIKNPRTAVHKSLAAIPAAHRLLLTGTPLQNNLGELHTLFNYISHGQLLGSRTAFDREVASAILAARDREATQEQRAAGDEAMKGLRQLIVPHFLRREKSREYSAASPAVGGAGGKSAGTDVVHEILHADSSEPTSAATGRTPRVRRVKSVLDGRDTLGEKRELVLWTRLSAAQHALYKSFLESEEVRLALNSTNSPLAALSVLRNICLHPSFAGGLRQPKATAPAVEDDGGSNEDVSQPPTVSIASLIDDAACEERGGNGDSAAPSGTDGGPTAVAAPVDTQKLLQESGKLAVAAPLFRLLHAEGHRTLVFSASKRLLDMIAVLLDADKLGWTRIDGDVTSMDERARRVKRFNTGSSQLPFCLLTTGVGALGLTLTGADRVVLLDPSWNPAIDAQAVDRAYRLGQKSDVVTYRLITCGTVEERMYRLQVFKGGLSRQVVSGASSARLLASSDMRALFTLGDVERSATARIVAKHAPPNRGATEELVRHLASLGRPPMSEVLADVSFHDVLFADTRFSGDAAAAAATAEAMVRDLRAVDKAERGRSTGYAGAGLSESDGTESDDEGNDDGGEDLHDFIDGDAAEDSDGTADDGSDGTADDDDECNGTPGGDVDGVADGGSDRSAAETDAVATREPGTPAKLDFASPPRHALKEAELSDDEGASSDDEQEEEVTERVQLPSEAATSAAPEHPSTPTAEAEEACSPGGASAVQSIERCADALALQGSLLDALRTYLLAIEEVGGAAQAAQHAPGLQQKAAVIGNHLGMWPTEGTVC